VGTLVKYSGGGRRSGGADLPLHGGRAPKWLFERMVPLAREILLILRTDYDSEEILRRLSDPYWFQAFGCVLGFDWHSSGLTTTTGGAIKEAVRGIEKELDFYVAGGKGATSRKTPAEIEKFAETLGLDPAPLVRASKLAAKVDNTAVQSGHQLYHHNFFFTGSGNWAVVQQGMSAETKTARRYHWLSENIESFTNEPDELVASQDFGVKANFVAAESSAVRQAVVSVAGQDPTTTLALINKLPNMNLPARHYIQPTDINPRYMHKILLSTYQNPPADFEDLLSAYGIGPKSLRSLALIAELIYGTPVSTRDPARFSFAHGGKDGIPYPVDEPTYDKTIRILHDALERARLNRTEKLQAFRRLSRFEMPQAELPLGLPPNKKFPKH
jgi:uncharacterized protein